MNYITTDYRHNFMVQSLDEVSCKVQLDRRWSVGGTEYSAYKGTLLVAFQGFPAGSGIKYTLPPMYSPVIQLSRDWKSLEEAKRICAMTRGQYKHIAHVINVTQSQMFHEACCGDHGIESLRYRRLKGNVNQLLRMIEGCIFSGINSKLTLKPKPPVRGDPRKGCPYTLEEAKGALYQLPDQYHRELYGWVIKECRRFAALAFEEAK